MPIPVVILAGGTARRMGGGDKGQFPFQGGTLLDAVIARLRLQAAPILLNANGDASRFARYGLDVIADSCGEGPLAGVLAAVEWAAMRGLPHIVTVPTDVPFLPLDVVSRLAAAITDPSLQAIACAQSQGRLHPTVALWPTAIASDLRRVLVEDGLRRMQDFLARRTVWPVSFPDAVPDPFTNVNDPAGLAAAQKAPI